VKVVPFFKNIYVILPPPPILSFLTGGTRGEGNSFTLHSSLSVAEENMQSIFGNQGGGGGGGGSALVSFKAGKMVHKPKPVRGSYKPCCSLPEKGKQCFGAVHDEACGCLSAFQGSNSFIVTPDERKGQVRDSTKRSCLSRGVVAQQVSWSRFIGSACEGRR
jgi:hypothetical protein